MGVALAILHHDPRGRLTGVLAEVAPLLRRIFEGVAVRASTQAPQEALEIFAQGRALITRDPPADPRVFQFGRARREAVALALELGAAHVLYVDGDRLLHWAERYPDELEHAVGWLQRCDLAVLGRTPRAWASHPSTLRATEQIVNDLFAGITGWRWDTQAGARGLSRRAATELIEGCRDDEISVDVSWPLHLRQLGGFALDYLEVEGLEFETLDRYAPELVAAGGAEAWLRAVEADPRSWLVRLDFARRQVEAMVAFAQTSPVLD